jgi:chromosome segregation ATPase
MQESEQEEDPAFAKAKAELKEANDAIRQLQQGIRKTEQEYSAKLKDAEQRLHESEQRYQAVGDVVRYLFGTDLALRDRIRGVRTSFPRLSQNGIAQLLGCSVSTVNDALDGYVIEMPVEKIEE